MGLPGRAAGPGLPPDCPQPVPGFFQGLSRDIARGMAQILDGGRPHLRPALTR